MAAGGHDGLINEVDAAQLLDQGEGGVDGAGRDRAQPEGGAALLEAGEQILGLAQVQEHADGGVAVAAAGGGDEAPVDLPAAGVAVQRSHIRRQKRTPAATDELP